MNAKIKRFLLVVFVCVVAALAVFSMVWNGTGKNRTVSVLKKSSPASWSVTMSPCGTVTFQKVPERVITLDANYNDMLETVGKGGALIATGAKYNFYDGFYRQIPGFHPTVAREQILYLYGDNTGNAYDKEFFYRMKADLHHIDPIRLAQSKSWTREDVEEIARNVGPFLANRFSRENKYSGPGEYTFYNVWEISEKVASAYRAGSVVSRLAEFGERLTKSIQAKLPPEEKRPTVALVFTRKDGFFTPYSLQNEGYAQAQYRAIGLRDAFAVNNIRTYGEGQIGAIGMDLEGLVRVNPDIIIMPFGIYALQFPDGPNSAAMALLKSLENDPLAMKISAVKNKRVYPGGTPLQGPLFYLFQLEMAAKQVYPEIFGPYREDGYPESEQLFSRTELAGILRGEKQ